MRGRVGEKIRLIIEAISTTGLSLDSEHNFMTDKRIQRIIPAVVYDAHEKCKIWGHKLESELKSAIVARLAELKRIRGVTATGFKIVPVQIREYLQQMKNGLEKGDQNEPLQLPEGDSSKDEHIS